MIRRTLLAAFTVFGAAVLAAPPAHAGPQAEAVIEGAAEQIRTGAHAASELPSLIDTRRVARFTLGRHARTLPDEAIDRYADALQVALDSTFQRHAGRLEGASLSVIGSVDRNPRDSIVTTRLIGPGGDPLTVRWRVIERDGDWRIVDVEALGIWLAIEQRAQVSAILARRGATIDDVIHAFNRQVAELTAEDGQG